MIKKIINPAYASLEDFVNELPNTFGNEGEVVYTARNIIKAFDVGGYRANVKSFKKPLLINQWVYATFRPSKAKRSYEYAMRLMEMGVHTPAPIAYMEWYRNNLLKNSLYVSIHEQFDGILREPKHGTLADHQELLKQFALFTAELHNKKILHIDYSAGNILYKKNNGNYTFYLVDLNRMEFDKPINLDKACHNFRRLWGSEEMISYFASEYAKARKLDVDQCCKLTLKYHKQFWDNHVAKHPDATPYVAE